MRQRRGRGENCTGFVRSSGVGNQYQGDGFSVKTSCQWVAECRDGEAFYNPEGNANFIAASRTAIPALIAENARLKAMAGELAGALEYYAKNARSWISGNEAERAQTALAKYRGQA